MTIEELQKIKESLEELSPDIGEFSWGPTFELALERRHQAVRIINREIRKMKNASKS